jgi:hypothetical protein
MVSCFSRAALQSHKQGVLPAYIMGSSPICVRFWLASGGVDPDRDIETVVTY